MSMRAPGGRSCCAAVKATDPEPDPKADLGSDLESGLESGLESDAVPDPFPDAECPLGPRRSVGIGLIRMLTPVASG